jgi:hypothetical protein
MGVLYVGVPDGIRILDAAALRPALQVARQALSRAGRSWSPAGSAPDSNWQADHTAPTHRRSRPFDRSAGRRSRVRVSDAGWIEGG